MMTVQDKLAAIQARIDAIQEKHAAGENLTPNADEAIILAVDGVSKALDAVEQLLKKLG